MKKLIAKFLIYLMFLSIGFSFGINANAEEIVLVDELQSSPDETINDSVGDVIEDDEDAIISDNSPASDEDNIAIYELSEETFSEANLEGSGFAEQSIDNEEVEANTLTLENEVVAEASELEISDPIASNEQLGQGGYEDFINPSTEMKQVPPKGTVILLDENGKALYPKYDEASVKKLFDENLLSCAIEVLGEGSFKVENLQDAPSISGVKKALFTSYYAFDRTIQNHIEELREFQDKEMKFTLYKDIDVYFNNMHRFLSFPYNCTVTSAGANLFRIYSSSGENIQLVNVENPSGTSNIPTKCRIENVVIDGRDVSKGIVCQSANILEIGPNVSIQNCKIENDDNFGAAITVQDNGQLIINGESANPVNIKNNHSNKNGAILLRIGASAEINKANFINNSSLGNGGAIYTYSSDTGNLFVKDSNFHANESKFGGAIFAAANTTIEKSDFSKNTSVKSGGAIYSSNTLSINGSSFKENSANWGGAIFATANTTIEKSDFSKNTSVKSGGAIYSSNTLSINGSSFKENSANWGGAIFATANTTIEKSDFSKNTSVKSGGAISSDKDLKINGGTFESNKSTTAQGGAIYSIGKGRELNIAEVKFESNEADFGGAIFSGGGEVSDAIIENSVFKNNMGFLSGGAIDSRSKLKISGSHFEENVNKTTDQSTGTGGAILSTATLTIDSSYFISNSSQHGGALYLFADAKINTSKFEKNVVTTTDPNPQDSINDISGGFGGAIYIQEGSVDIGDSNFEKNNAAKSGGAIELRKGARLNLRGGSFIKNVCEIGQGGAIQVHPYAYEVKPDPSKAYVNITTADNTVFQGNRAPYLFRSPDNYDEFNKDRLKFSSTSIPDNIKDPKTGYLMKSRESLLNNYDVNFMYSEDYRRYPVKFEFVDKDGENLPQTVHDLLPAPEDAQKNAVVSPPQPSQTEVVVGNGKWIFQGWNPESAIMPEMGENGADPSLTFTGKWEFKAILPEDKPNTPKEKPETSKSEAGDKKGFTIIFDPKGGTLRGDTKPVQIHYDEPTEITIIEAPIREGYKFLYWKGSEYQPGDKFQAIEDHTFVAVWEAKFGANIIDEFVESNIEQIMPIKTIVGSSVEYKEIKLPSPTVQGGDQALLDKTTSVSQATILPEQVTRLPRTGEGRFENLGKVLSLFALAGIALSLRKKLR